MDSITLDTLYRGEDLNITYTAMDALGEGGWVEVTGNKLAGRISVQTGVGSSGKTVARILFPEGNTFDTDNLRVMLFPNDNKFFQVVPQGVEGNGFEIYSKELWDDNSNYEFNYLIVAKLE